MPKFNDRLKLLRRESGLSQMDFAKQLGLSKSSVNMYERGEREPSLETLEAIADYFNVDMDYLLGKSEHRNKNQWLKSIDQSTDLEKLRKDVQIEFDNLFRIERKKFPLLGNIACGEPILATGEIELYVMAGAEINADFCLRAKGDSMTGARIYDGDIVFIKKQEMVDNGEIAAVIIGDEATLKRVYYDRENNVLQLFAENPQYKTMRFTGEDLNQIRIIGKAVAFQSDVK